MQVKEKLRILATITVEVVTKLMIEVMVKVLVRASLCTRVIDIDKMYEYVESRVQKFKWISAV